MSDGLNLTNAVPPICNRHGESMVLSFYDRPGSAPGNGYVCRSCAKERMVEQTLKLSGKAETSPERAELQVSLLNEIGLTLTAVAERLKPIERIDTIEGMILDLAQRLYGRLEGIETTLIKEFIDAKQSRDSDYALDDRRWEVMHDRVQAIESQLTAMAKEQVAHREVFKCLSLQLQAIDNDLAAKWATRLAQIEERLRAEMEGMRNIVDALGERLEPCKVCAGKRRVHALFERKTLENKATTVDEIMAAHDGRKPRKAGERPAPKAGKRLKTSKL